MNILVLGGTRFFGIHMVNALLEAGHEVTIATRGNAKDSFGERVKRIIVERTSEESMKQALSGIYYDVVIDKLAYSSNDVRIAMNSIDCDKYIQMSSTAVYNPKKSDTVEEDFNGQERPVIWCDRTDFPYDEVKRQAEYALWQEYSDKNWIAVRYPVVLGRDDYTNRLKFYVDHVISGTPMYIDNIDYQMSYIKSDEAGQFMAFLVDKGITGARNGASNEVVNGVSNGAINGSINGAINGASNGTISLREIINYVEEKTGKKAVVVGDERAAEPVSEEKSVEPVEDNRTTEPAEGKDRDRDILADDIDKAPYNGDPEFSINTDKAKELGFEFSDIRDWIFDLLDYYINYLDLSILSENTPSSLRRG